MSDTPTVEGSIVAKLKVDKTEAAADLAEFQAQAEALKTANPDIKVTADTGKAEAALAAVTAAEKRLSDAETASTLATGRATLAQMRLAEVRDSGTATDYQLASAEFALEAATARSDAAAEKAWVAEDALTTARAKLAAVTAALDGAEEEESNTSDRANAIHTSSFSRITAIIAAVAALVPLLAPVGAYAIAAAGGLAGMGAAGILAILGIKNAMAEGTTAGNEYSAGLNVLHGDLNSLASTAALGMLKSFNQAVDTINSAMPDLTSETRDFTGILGGAGNSALSATINFLRVLNPLFLEGAAYVQHLAQEFEAWTNSKGIQTFATYAERELPAVSNLLGTLASTILNIIEALAPAGAAMIGFLTIFANVLNFLASAGPVFAAVVAGITAGTIAFKLFGSVAPLIQQVAVAIGAVGEAEDLALGPIGLLIAGVTALVAVFSVSVAASQQSAQAVDNYTAAVQADNGVIGENVRLQTAKNLQDQGALDNAKKLGVSTDQLVKAATGNTAAQKSVNDTLDKQADSYKQVSDGSATYVARIQGLSAAQRQTKSEVDATRSSMDDQSSAIKLAIKAYNDLQDAIGGTTIKTSAQLYAQQNLANSYGVSVSVFEGAIAAQKNTADQAKATTLQFQLENDAAGILQDSLDKMNGKALSAADAQNAFDSSLANMGTHVTDAGKQITFTTANIGNMSAASVSLRGQLNQQIEALEGVVEANGGLKGSTSQAQAQMAKMRQQIIDNAVAHGVDRDAVTDYINQLLKIPASIPPTKLDIDTSQATAELNSFLKLAATRVVQIPTKLSGESVPTAGKSVIPTRAGGGFVDGPGTTTSDSVFARLSRKEFVVKASSAGQHPGFLNAYNDNPNRALASVSGGKSISAPITVYEATNGTAVAQTVVHHLVALGV